MRQLVADAIRARVGGPTGQAHARELFESEGPRWFGPDRAIWRVHADAAIFVGALRALLLQSLHPLAMAGVAQHSDFREDPWGRLQRTARFLAGTTYGTAAQAEQACATVRRVHGRVRGIAPDGRSYDANDPHLLLWVHLAEVDSFLAAHQRFGARPLDRAERDQYVSDLGRVARELGVPDPPVTVGELARPVGRLPPGAGHHGRSSGGGAVLAAATTGAPGCARAVHRARGHGRGAPAVVGEGHVARPTASRDGDGRHPAGREGPRRCHALGVGGRSAPARRVVDGVGHTGEVNGGVNDQPDDDVSSPAHEDEEAPPRRPSSLRGGMLGAAMLGLRDVLEGPKKEKIVIQAEAPGEPPDIDRRGFEAPLEDGSLAVGPPLDDLKDKAHATRRSHRLRRRSSRRT